jgi:hypothetical protein
MQMPNTGHDSNKSTLHALINKDNIKSNDACHHSVQNLLSSTLLYRNIILPLVFCGYKTCSLKLEEERRPKEFENRVLRKTFGS